MTFPRDSQTRSKEISSDPSPLTRRSPLNTDRIDEELVAPGQIAVGVEHDPEVIVAEDPVAFAERHAHRRGIVVGDQGDVEVLVVVGNPGLRIDRRPSGIARGVLGEVACVGHRLPARIVQFPIDPDRTRGAGDLQCRLVAGREPIVLGSQWWSRSEPQEALEAR